MSNIETQVGGVSEAPTWSTKAVYGQAGPAARRKEEKAYETPYV